MNLITFIAAYLIALNIIGFILMGIDKRKARLSAYRIPEATLFIVAIIGGSLGSILGMHLFHHKTRHWYFVYGMPLILFIQLLIVFLLWKSPIQFRFI